ncbi:DUF1569 domain-containing protein [Aliikangiella marina]|uniref:DUF1569 domain-containing protein n=1 Tax=Aliikangiella marina TaxID=1712262 RepID=UPI00163DA483|nr:DUF1569 domain-containing protein [Aliikangiella marina]
MKRRKLLKAGLSASGLLLAGGTTGFYLGRVEDRSILSLDVLSGKLQQLKGETLNSSGDWNPVKVFLHCAKSIEFSMIGFPVHRSSAFKNVVGTSAFSTFASLGKMHHALDEPIPGEDSLRLTDSKVTSTAAAINILLDRINAFTSYQGELKEHFAFGKLSKDEYELAHVMHVYNHLAEIVT